MSPAGVPGTISSSIIAPASPSTASTEGTRPEEANHPSM
ncbi:Uncharacterised protein [Streptomyces griseus]|nr:Uncharacterised protein [Streptomyces griseus]